MTKDRTIPQEPLERFWSLLPAAALHILEHVRNCLTSKIVTKNSSFLPELQVSEEYYEIYFLNNGKRQHTLLLQYAGSGHLYIALTLEAFSKFVFS